TLWLSALLAAWRGDEASARDALDTLAARGLGRFVGRGRPTATGLDATDASVDSVPAPGAQDLRATAAGMEASHARGLGYLQLPEVAVELACHLGEVSWANVLYAELLPSAGKPFLLTTLSF